MKKVFAAVTGLLAVGLVIRAIFFSGVTPPASASTTPNTAPSPAAQAADAAAPAGSNAAAPAAAAPEAPVNLDELAKGVEEVRFLYDRMELARNPMTPLVGPQAVFAATAPGSGDGADQLQAQSELLAQQLSVTGIIWDKTFPVAVINDDVVAPGDVLPGGVVVEAIGPDRVTVKAGQTSIPLQLKVTEEQ
jgi:hypothetical protein